MSLKHLIKTPKHVCNLRHCTHVTLYDTYGEKKKKVQNEETSTSTKTKSTKKHNIEKDAQHPAIISKTPS